MAPNPLPSEDITLSKVTDSLDAALRLADVSYVNSKKFSRQELIANALMEELHQCGKNLGYDVPYITENAKVDWLYDMIWKGDPNEDTPLVVECNLSSDFRSIRNDFEKMLMSRSELRLLITFAGSDEKDVVRALENITKLKGLIPYNSSSSPDHFLFATIVPDSNGGLVFRYDFV